MTLNINYMSFFRRNKADDCTEVSQVIKNQHDGNRGVELIMNDDGEMIAVPSSQVDQVNGIKATEIAKKDYYVR